MALHPEKGGTAVRLGAVLAASLAVNAAAKTPNFHKNTHRKPHQNELMVDHETQLAMLSKDVKLILHNETQKTIPHVRPRPKHHSSTSPLQVRYTPALSHWLYELRSCESTDNYGDTVGIFRGAYQFLPSEWVSIAEKTDHTRLVRVPANEASPRDQDTMIVLNTVLSSGGLATQNPGCFEKKHLSPQPPGISAGDIQKLEHGGQL